MIRMYKYSCEGFSFMMVDGRDADIPRFRSRRDVHALCLLNAADGLAILTRPDCGGKGDFTLELFDASGCRCVTADSPSAIPAIRCSVAFADLVGVKAFHSVSYSLTAPDGSVRHAEILSHLGECKVIRLLPGGTETPSDAPVLCEGDLLD